MNLKEKRKLINDGIKNGNIAEVMTICIPSSTSRAIECLDSDMCDKILAIKVINWEEVTEYL